MKLLENNSYSIKFNCLPLKYGPSEPNKKIFKRPYIWLKLFCSQHPFKSHLQCDVSQVSDDTLRSHTKAEGDKQMQILLEFVAQENQSK